MRFSAGRAAESLRHSDDTLDRLTYSFVESVKASYPFWTIRFIGGLMFLSGMLVMAYNMFKTIAGGKTEDGLIPAAAAHHA